VRVLQIFTAYCLLMFTFTGYANVKAVGLMSNMAILEKDGQRLVIKAGQEKQGVKLISSDSQQCVIEMNGKRQTLALGASLASGYSAPQGKQVRLPKGPRGQYFSDVKINGRTVRMLVDTGATNVALSGDTARQLGISYANGIRGRSATAGGIVHSFLVRVNEVNLQGITRYNVAVNVIEGSHPNIPLLGMSFLGQLKMTQDQGELVISE